MDLDFDLQVQKDPTLLVDSHQLLPRQVTRALEINILQDHQEQDILHELSEFEEKNY